MLLWDCTRGEFCKTDPYIYEFKDCDGDGIKDHICTPSDKYYREFEMISSSDGCTQIISTNCSGKQTIVFFVFFILNLDLRT